MPDHANNPMIEPPDPGSILRVDNTEDGSLMVDLRRDGSVVFGESYEPEKAARQVWEAIASYIEGRVFTEEEMRDAATDD